MNLTPKSVPAVLATFLIGFCVIAGTASAVPITGRLALKGMFELNGTGLADATAFTSFSNVAVTSGSGDYMSVPGGTPVTYAPQPGDPDGGFSFNPLDPDPLEPLWTFTLGPTNYSFDLYSVSIVLQNDFALVLKGSGISRITGFDDTAGSWNFMTTSFGPTLFEFTNSTHVPDGGSTVALLSFALLGVLTLGRKLEAAANA